MKNRRQRRLMLSAFQTRLALIVLGAVALVLALTLQRINVTAQQAESTPANAAGIVEVANDFLESLDETQREAVLFDFNDEAQRNNWSNSPTGIVQRAGLAYGSLTEDQQVLAMILLDAALSDEGFDKLIDAMTADEILRQTDASGNLVFGFGQYYISILGTPSETDPWILQWGGHHFALNITFDGEYEVLTPSYMGCQPCAYIINDQPVQVLGDEYNKALALLNVLDADQQAQAILDYTVSNLVLGPGEEERVLEPEGLPGSAMTDEQQGLLLDVISEWVNIANEAAAAVRMAELQANIADTYFAWSGDTTGANATAYFRITGPTLLIEFAPQGVGDGGGQAEGQGDAGQTGDETNPTADNDFTLDLGTFEVITDATTLYHVHTIYRDPTNPYGSAAIGQ